MAQRRGHVRTRWGYWCWGDNSKGRRVALGHFPTEAEAYERGATAYPATFKVYMLDTINLVAAKQKLKAKDLEEGRNIDMAMRHASQQLP